MKINLKAQCLSFVLVSLLSAHVAMADYGEASGHLCSGALKEVGGPRTLDAVLALTYEKNNTGEENDHPQAAHLYYIQGGTLWAKGDGTFARPKNQVVEARIDYLDEDPQTHKKSHMSLTISPAKKPASSEEDALFTSLPAKAKVFGTVSYKDGEKVRVGGDMICTVFPILPYLPLGSPSTGD